MCKKVWICIFLGFILLMSAYHALAESYQPIRVEPSRFIFDGEPGKQVTGSLQVTNKGSEPATIRAILSDWTIGPNGELNTLEAGTLKSTLSSWIKFNPRQFTLQPGQTQTVRFSIKVPQDISGTENRGIIGFEQTIPYQGEEVTGAEIKVQVTSTIYVSIPPTERKCMVVGSHLETDPAKGNSIIHLDLRGLGTAHFRGTGTFRIFTPGNEEPIESGNFGSLVLLPEVETRFSANINTIFPPGIYHIVLEIFSDEIPSEPVIRQVYQYTVPETVVSQE